MAGLNGLINTVRGALSAHSFGLAVTSQNIANAATPGYVRREALLQTRAVGNQTYGTVEAIGLRRATDVYTSRRYYESIGLGSAASHHYDKLRQIEGIFNDLQGAGLGESLDALFGSFSALAANPADPVARTAVLERAETFAIRANDMASELATQRDDLLHEARETVTSINAIAEDLARIERQIAIAKGGGSDAADLMQEREQLLRKLGEFVDIRVIEDGGGGIVVQAAGATLVEGGRANGLGVDLDSDGRMRIFATPRNGPASEVTRFLSGGKLAALREARDEDLFELQSALDEFVFDVGTAINQQHAAGYGLDGVSGRNLFDVGGTSVGAARAIRVSADVFERPDRIAAAGSADSLPGGSDNAVALVRLGSSPIVNGNPPSTAYGSIVANIGLKVSRAEGEVAHREAVHSQLEAIWQSTSGVSLDEEMVALSKFQRAYEAASRVLSTIDRLLEDLMQVVR
ncbi:MAG: flagellar hook-associated protein FlgK [Pseudomonadota bacterium]